MKYEGEKQKEQKFDQYEMFTVLCKRNFASMSHDSGLNIMLCLH